MVPHRVRSVGADRPFAGTPCASRPPCGPAWQADGFRLVFLATTDTWTCQRFTLVHELGHILAGDAQELLTEAGPAPGRQTDYSEVRANVFAVNFPMPERDRRGTGRARVIACADSPPSSATS
ncbi:ImmA/IrrE family metallo-endopeptidase [Streptomyces smaragdinus]|uniref:ImmA/IrrE family metallo-endopeptidase n=1 Tax=Streptomyces smaragdinus TaxID=2585196 RepID=UPI001295F2D0